MNARKRLVASGAIAMLMATGPASAASISYFLDQSNELPDGVNYLQVTISDGTNGAIDFLVEALEPLTSIARNNFGIQSFSFNFGSAGGDAGNIMLPDGWRVTENSNHSEFGRFDISLDVRGNVRQDPLRFSVTGIGGDSVGDYTGFAAHVADFDAGRISSAQFGGSTVVPLPASVWLFLSGIGVLGFVRLRDRLRSWNPLLGIQLWAARQCYANC